MALNKNNFAPCCSFCLQSGVETVKLFEEINESEIVHKISLCFQVIFLPYRKSNWVTICFNCIKEVNNAYNFRMKCISLDERLKTEAIYAQTEENCSKNKENDDGHCAHENAEIYNEITNNNLDQFDCKVESICCDNINDSYKCSLCKKLLKTKLSLLKHYVTMHEKRKHIGKVSGSGPDRRYHCTTCSYSTPHSQTLVNHMRRHNGERPYVCECGKSFTQSSSLAAHQKTHSNATYFTCSKCGKQFKHAFTLKNHLRVHEVGMFSCGICYKTLKSKQTLKSHMRRHYNICNYNCEACGDTFVTSAELLNHKKKHSLEKKVECHICGYKTHTKKNLIIHLKRHTGNRAFKCNKCQIAFYTQSNLRRHERVHTRDKPFSCPTCAQKFTYSPSLNKHMKAVHGVDFKWTDYKWKDTKLVKFPKT